MDRSAIEYLANLASILTAIVAVCAWSLYGWSGRHKRKKLETYLKNEKQKRQDKGQRSLLHLMANVGLTDSEILQASFKSRYIKRLLTTSAATHLANDILFEYDPDGNSR